MIILGIETSCDETAAAVVQKSGNRVTILSNVVASSASLQAKYGGVIPEQAAREQIKSIIPVIEEAITQAAKTCGVKSADPAGLIDAIAVTYGPGLIGSLLVGVETTKTLATIWKKPLIPVNHLLGHFYANWLGEKTPTFPCLGLLVSGGHTDLVLFKDHSKYQYLGGTRDDASGECFDKCARLLNLPYPGGPEIAKLAAEGDASKFDLPRPMINSKDFDFSFSGLKTAVANLLHVSSVALSPSSVTLSGTKGITPELYSSATPQNDRKKVQDDKMLADLAAGIEQAIVDVLVTKTLKATQKYKVKEIIVAGGVAANQKLASDLKLEIRNLKLEINLHIPPPALCTDNAAMIAAAAFFNYHPVDPLTLQANPNLNLSDGK
ncbi:MAG: tRNA (adenosine(37)-N6)-threonylcarbamoyltransferase complex transferase subunit TsaD [Candidatus Daviesbacteria bacterium]|nr:tRNA (adenosine(37)-N6)-threonylcarbamoyltransferase complex transferase subunit TsaD [Candidatus Daviesbacteria bacterium]